MPESPTTWKLTLSYDGAPFHGWQVQPGRPTVQGTLAAALEQITGERVLPQGSGRTDAGVHALAQVASFALAAPIPAANLLRALNQALPPSVRILRAEAVAESFHARHSARRKSYEYRIFERRIAERRIAVGDSLGGPFIPRTWRDEWDSENAQATDRICSPFLAHYVWDCDWPLHLEAMQIAAAHWLGTQDFTSFAASDPDRAERRERRASAGMTSKPENTATSSAPNPVKTIYASSIAREGDLLIFRVTGSGFLHHMVRNLIGTLVEVGRCALAPADIPRILAARNRGAAGPTAPASGLYLVSVEYDAEPCTSVEEDCA